jgi:hypothetical protein
LPVFFSCSRSKPTAIRRPRRKKTKCPDFYIGAHALVAGMTLLTRDAARYRSYFPSLRLVAP